MSTTVERRRLSVGANLAVSVQYTFACSAERSAFLQRASSREVDVTRHLEPFRAFLACSVNCPEFDGPYDHVRVSLDLERLQKGCTPGEANNFGSVEIMAILQGVDYQARVFSVTQTLSEVPMGVLSPPTLIYAVTFNITCKIETVTVENRRA